MASRRPSTCCATRERRPGCASSTSLSRSHSTAGAGGRASGRRSSAASSCVRTGRRWASSGSTAAGSRPNWYPTPTRLLGRRSIVDEQEIRIAPRAELPPQPAGHLLQAGPCSSATGTPLRHLDDAEGFVAGAHQFDSDITAGRHPRAALAVSADELIALVCDGRRTGVDAGLTLAELAELIAGLGACEAINLDGGGSTALVHHGHLLNRPYDHQDRPSRSPRPVATAAIFHTATAERDAA